VIGSVKSNLGHTQAAAGAAGVMKVILALEHEEIPCSLHAAESSPHVAWSELPVEVATAPRPWRRGGKPRIAGISSFGISGTNAHVIVEEPPRREGQVARHGGADVHVIVDESPHRDELVARAGAAQLVVLSGRSEAALRDQLARVGAALDTALGTELGTELSAAELAYNLATTRTAFEHRAAIVVGSTDELRSISPSRVMRGRADASAPAFVFSGQGSQLAGMGRELHAAWPAFRAAFDAALAHFDPELRDVMWSEDGRLDRTRWTQPALFVYEYALAALWRSWGVEPAVVIGHSIGEIVAACVVGVLSLRDATVLVAGRARLMDALPDGGAMASIGAPESEVAHAIAELGGLEIAAVNGPALVTIAGAREQIAAACELFAARGVRTKQLAVSHAFHSAHMEPMLDAFRGIAAGLTYRAPALPIISNLTGAVAGPEIATAEYWVEHVRRAVRFGDGVMAAVAAGARSFVEIGPRTVLLGAVAASQPDAIVIPGHSHLHGLGEHWVHGGHVEWSGVFPDGGRRIALPTYAWQHVRYWADARAASAPTVPALAQLLDRLVVDAKLSAAARAAMPEIIAALTRDEGMALAVAESRHSPAATTDASASSDAIDAWFHAIAWRDAAEPRGDVAGRWIVVAGAQVDDRVHGANGADVRFAGSLSRALGSGALVARDVSDVATALGYRRSARGTTPIETVRGLPADIQGTATRGVIYVGGDPAMALELAKLVAAHGSTRLWLVTSGAVSTATADPVRAPDSSTMWGLGRAIALEHPQVWGGLVDVAASVAESARRTAAWIASGADDQVAIRDTGSFVARVVRTSTPVATRAFSTAGTAVVTGGLGGLGLHVARWLADRGVTSLLLVGRRGLATPGAREAVADLESRGARVHVAAADSADRAAMAAALGAVSVPISAVFHVAGVADTTPLAELTRDHLLGVLAAKQRGTEILDDLTRDLRLDAFVCFSSIAGAWGAGRQAAYSAANAYLDGWASAARARGIPAVSIGWGPWAGDGLADEAARDYLAKRGLAALDPARAMDAMTRVLASDASHVVIADVNWPLFRAGFEAWGPRPVLAELASGEAALSGSRTDDAKPHMAGIVASLRPAARLGHIEDWLAAECAVVLGHADASELARDRGFFDLGLDSLMAVKLVARVRAGLGIKLSPAVIFEQPNLAALAIRVLADLQLSDDTGATPAVDAKPEMFEGSDDDALNLISALFDKVT